MCGRYYISEDAENEMLAEYVRQAQERAQRTGGTVKTAGEVRPTDMAPVVATGARRRTVGAFPMRWGFLHPSRGMLIFNTRSETASEKPLFAASLRERRCLIPASGYFEWQSAPQGKAQKIAFTRADGAPLLLAGLYLRKEGMDVPCFTVLTRDAAQEQRAIHPRMPVILSASQTEEWLSPDGDYASLIASACTIVTAHEAGR